MTKKMPLPSLPSGTRDFSHEAIYKREYVQHIIKKYFQLYGFSPLETPAMELLSVLSGKYGDEGDKLIFKILNNGLHEKSEQDDLKQAIDRLLQQGIHSSLLTERALKYDLTIPLARYVVMNEHNIPFPFKRFQMQSVWRADKPQKGRYREFTQCDADIVGSNSLWDEVELLHLYLDIFQTLGLEVKLQMNHRSVLEALQLACGRSMEDKSLIIAIDKLDKIGLEKVLLILEKEHGFEHKQLSLIEQYLSLQGNTFEKIDQMRALGLPSAQVEKVAHDFSFILQHLKHEKAHQISFEPTLARGLDYYNGCIFEVKSQLASFTSSIGGGGRYDNLTALFGGRELAGIGISLGLDRIVDVMELSDLFPPHTQQKNNTQVLWINFDEEQSTRIYPHIQAMRKVGIRTELYAQSVKIDKQLKYAEQRKINFVIIAGAKELAEKIVTIKNMNERTQVHIAIDDLLGFDFE